MYREWTALPLPNPSLSLSRRSRNAASSDPLAPDRRECERDCVALYYIIDHPHLTQLLKEVIIIMLILIKLHNIIITYYLLLHNVTRLLACMYIDMGKDIVGIIITTYSMTSCTCFFSPADGQCQSGQWLWQCRWVSFHPV